MAVPGPPSVPGGMPLPPGSAGTKPPGLSALKIVAIVVVAIVVLGAIALLGLLWFASNFKPPPPVVEQTRSIYNGTFGLNAGQSGPTAWSSSFTVSAAEAAHAKNVSGGIGNTGFANPTLSVSFLATGQTIQVYVMDATQFYNYQHRGQFSVYYLSGQVYADRRSITLEPTPGTYYVVAENTALYGTASVSAAFVLHY